MSTIPTPKYILEIGQVTKVKQHKSDNDGVNYFCDIMLDSDNSLPNVPVASSRVGFVCIPEIEDQVLVGFIRGNLSMPIILGILYNDKIKPPLYNPGEAVYVCPEYKKKESDYPKLEELKRIYMELPKHKMKFCVREEDVHYELKTDKEKYMFDLKLKDGIRLEVSEKTSLAISKDGDITITAKDTKISINKEGEIAIDAKQKVGIKTTADVNLESSGGNMKLTANKITLDGKQDVEIKGMNTKIEAQTSLELKGMSAKVEAQASLNLKSSATTNVEAGAAMTIKGAIVNIN